jgi:hypothetical protein
MDVKAEVPGPANALPTWLLLRETALWRPQRRVHRQARPRPDAVAEVAVLAGTGGFGLVPADVSVAIFVEMRSEPRP